MARLCVATKGFGGSLCLCNTSCKGSQTSSLGSYMIGKADMEADMEADMHVAPLQPNVQVATMTQITPVNCALHARRKRAFIRESRSAVTSYTWQTEKVSQERDAKLVHPAVCSGHVQDTMHIRQRLVPCDWCVSLHMQGCLPVSAISCLTC